jgi:1,4-dihydroxy-2-naphthoyl-CoA hydrolase
VDIDLRALERAGEEYLPGKLGIEFDGQEDGVIRSHLTLDKSLFAPNGYVHAGAIVTLADTTCGYGCILGLPDGASGFTTIELKTNFLRSAQAGTITCEAQLAHGGRTTQLWDATVRDAEGRTMALFRCTQLILR